jgi:Putative transposase, YhgA-like
MSLADDPPLRDLPDRVLRQSLRHPEHLRAFLQQAVPELAAGFDCERARLLDREFPLDDWRRREADLPFEVPYRTGDGEEMALVCVLIEHQSDTDPVMPLRMLYFAVIYWERQWREWERMPRPRPAFRLRPVLPIVLYTGAVPWGSNRSLADLLGGPEAFRAFAPSWQPLFWNLADRTPEELLATGAEWLQALAVIRAQAEAAAEFHAVFAQALRGLGELAGRDPMRWYDLMRILLTWVFWRRPDQEREALLAEARASHAEAASQKEIQTMSEKLGATLADITMAKGELKATRDLLRSLLEDRFGTVPEELLQRIEATDDLERLQTAARQVYRVQGLEEISL